MRRPRIKAEGAGYYHCMSRVIERRHIFGHAEKRYFSDGLALGSQAFLEPIFHRYRDHFGQKRQSGARRMRYGLPRRSLAKPGDWGGLCTLRNLRLQAVSRC